MTQFRECVLSGAWDTVEQLSEQLDIDPVDGLPVISRIIFFVVVAFGGQASDKKMEIEQHLDCLLDYR